VRASFTVRGTAVLGKLAIRAIFGALGLWVASKLVYGVEFSNLTALVIAACVLGVVNAIVRPVVIVLTLPLTIVTLGLFLLIVNAAMIWLTSLVVPGFHVRTLLAGVLAAIITGVSAWIGGMVISDHRRAERRY
jgi:putative membrane protein